MQATPEVWVCWPHLGQSVEAAENAYFMDSPPNQFSIHVDRTWSNSNTAICYDGPKSSGTRCLASISARARWSGENPVQSQCWRAASRYEPSHQRTSSSFFFFSYLKLKKKTTHVRHTRTRATTPRDRPYRKHATVVNIDALKWTQTRLC